MATVFYVSLAKGKWQPILSHFRTGNQEEKAEPPSFFFSPSEGKNPSVCDHFCDHQCKSFIMKDRAAGI